VLVLATDSAMNSATGSMPKVNYVCDSRVKALMKHLISKSELWLYIEAHLHMSKSLVWSKLVFHSVGLPIALE
jgi:hypothetical protein